MINKNIISITALVVFLTAVGWGLGWFLGPRRFTKQVSTGQAKHDFWYCPMHPWIKSDKPGACPICGMTLVPGHAHDKQVQSAPTKEGTTAPAKKILYWTDPMIPGYKSDHPGKSPMGMDLIPVYEKDTQTRGLMTPEGYASISVTQQKQQLIGVRTAVAVIKPMIKSIRTVGIIASGAELYQTQSDFIDAYVDFIKVWRNFKHIRERRSSWEGYRDVQVRLLEVKDKLLKLGLGEDEIRQLEKVNWSQTWKQPQLLMFNDRRSFWVMAQIFEQDLNDVHKGQPVEISIPSYHRKIKGMVRSVGGFLDPATRSVTALIEFRGDAGQLAINTQVDVNIPVPLGNVLWVPREAVMDTGVRKIIFVQEGKDTFEPREIQTGRESDEGYEVKTGLKAGERIAVSGNFLLDSESRIQASLQGGGYGS